MWKSTHTHLLESRLNFVAINAQRVQRKVRAFSAKNPSVLCKLYVFVWCVERKFVILFGLVPHQKYYFPNEMNGEKRTRKYHQQICMSASTMWISNVNKKHTQIYAFFVAVRLDEKFVFMFWLCLVLYLMLLVLMLMLLLLLIPLSIIMMMFGDLTRIEWESDFGREHAHWMRGKCRQNDSFEICARLEATNNIFSLIQLQSSDDYSHTKILQIHTWVSACVCVSARARVRFVMSRKHQKL